MKSINEVNFLKDWLVRSWPVIFTCAFFTAALAQVPAGLSSTWKGPDMNSIRKILAEGDGKVITTKPAAAAGSPLNKFVSTVESGVPKTLGDVFGRDPAEKAALTDAFVQIRSGYNAEVEKSGRQNDLAAAMTFFIAANIAAYNRSELMSDEASEKLYASLSSLISSSADFSAMSSAEKSRMYDWLVCMAGFVATRYEDARTTNNSKAMTAAADLAKAAMRLVLGIDLEKFSVSRGGVQATESSPSTSVPGVAGAKHGSGITKSMSMSGPWTTRVDADFVHLTDGRINVYLFYPFHLTAEQRGDFDLATHCWNTYVVPRFDITSSQKFTDELPDVINWLYYYEGIGKSQFVAMKADNAQGGIVSVVVVVAPDRQAYKQMFPDPKGLSHLKGVNRFPLTAADLVGTWSDSAGYGLSFVNSDTGRFAGTTSTASSHEFTFSAGGTYQSKHAFAKTNFGGTTGGKEDHTGRFNVKDWELTVNGTAGSITYEAYFEAVKNGRILHLTQRGASGIQFNLGLVN